MGLASPVSQSGACPQVVNQQRLLFVRRAPNGGYNAAPSSGGGAGVSYNNPSMPNYVPAGMPGQTGGGVNDVWDVVDGGGNVNSAGAICSSSGEVLGKVCWDAILNQYVFVAKEARYTNIAAPSVAGSSNSTDGLQIKNFLTQLNNGVIQPGLSPTTPQINIAGLDNSLDGTGDMGGGQ